MIVVLPALTAVGKLITFAVPIVNIMLANVIRVAFAIFRVPVFKVISANIALRVPPEPITILELFMFIAVADDAVKVLLELMVRLALIFKVVADDKVKLDDVIVQGVFKVNVAPPVVPSTVQEEEPLIVNVPVAPVVKLSIIVGLPPDKLGSVIVLEDADALVKFICGLPVIVTVGAPLTEIADTPLNVNVLPLAEEKYIALVVPAKVIVENDMDVAAADISKMQLVKVNTADAAVKAPRPPEPTVQLAFKFIAVAVVRNPSLGIMIGTFAVIVVAIVVPFIVHPPEPVKVNVPPVLALVKLKIGFVPDVNVTTVIVLALADPLVKLIFGVPFIVSVPALYVQGFTAFSVILVALAGKVKMFDPEANVILPSDIVPLETSKVAPFIDKDAVPEIVQPATSIVHATPVIVRPDELRVPPNVNPPLPVKVKEPVPELPEKSKIGFVPDTVLSVTVLAFVVPA